MLFPFSSMAAVALPPFVKPGVALKSYTRDEVKSVRAGALAPSLTAALSTARPAVSGRWWTATCLCVDPALMCPLTPSTQEYVARSSD